MARQIVQCLGLFATGALASLQPLMPQAWYVQGKPLAPAVGTFVMVHSGKDSSALGGCAPLSLHAVLTSRSPCMHQR